MFSDSKIIIRLNNYQHFFLVLPASSQHPPCILPSSSPASSQHPMLSCVRALRSRIIIDPHFFCHLVKKISQHFRVIPAWFPRYSRVIDTTTLWGQFNDLGREKCHPSLFEPERNGCALCESLEHDYLLLSTIKQIKRIFSSGPKRCNTDANIFAAETRKVHRKVQKNLHMCRKSSTFVR